MNKLSPAQRAKVLQLLCEGMSIRAICRVLNVGKNTVARLLLPAGAACMDYQDKHLRDLQCRRIEVDELWSFVGSKEKNTPKELKGERGDAWTWVSICAESKLIPAWYVGSRDSEAAMTFMVLTTAPRSPATAIFLRRPSNVSLMVVRFVGGRGGRGRPQG